MFEGDDLAHYFFDKEEGQALVVVVVVRFDEIFGAVTEEGVDVALVQQQLAIGAYSCCLGHLQLLQVSLRLVFLLFQLLLSPRGQRLQILVILNKLPLLVPADDGALVRLFLFVLDNILHIVVELLLRADIMHVLHYLIGLYVKLGHIER